MSGSALLLPLLLLSLLSIALVRSCPRSCNCYQASEVHCTFRSLQTVPSGLPQHTRRINLGFNSIHLLQNSSLSGLKNVELLMLHSNHLQQIPPGVFSDLKNLQILKLSYNKLEELWSEHTFFGLSSLTRLYLDHNQLRWIHPRALLLLPRLRLLKLQGNRLLQLHPQALCTLSVLETYCYSTLRHLDLSNNSLSTVTRELLETAPLLETLVLHANPWSCDCGMNWLLDWTVSNPGVMKCPGNPQCPVCASPLSLQHQGLLDQPNLPCSAPLITSPGRDTPLDPSDIPEILPRQSFRESLGTLSLSLSDQQGFNVDVTCNVSQSYTSPDISSALSSFQSFPLSLALSFSLECHAERQNYEKLWRIMAYYSESSARLERGLMLSKAPTLAYRYRQAPETEGEYHTGVKASMAASPHWLLQPAVSIQLNRAKSNRKAVHLVLSTRVSAHSDLATSRPWVLISTNRTVKGLSALAGSTIELPCPILSSGGHKVEWIFPDGSKIIPSSSSSNSRWKVLSSGLMLQKLELSDAGLYYCKASNGKDTDILPLQLVVIELPASATRESVELSGVIGQPITISCNASGSPPPFTSWLLPNGNLLRHGSALSGGVTMEANGSLSLPKPSLRNAGHYRCIVVNQYGSDSLSTRLELKPLQTPPLKTTFPRRPQSAAGRSTKIRAPLLRSDEGSGDGAEEEEEEGAVRNRRPFLNNQRRRGPGRTGLANDRRNRLGSRHRVAPNRQRIDPKKWADLLAKIREKAITASDNQPAEPTEKSESKVNEEIESSSGDDTRMFEETVYPAKSQTNMETDGSSRINEATTKFDETTTQEPHEIATSYGQWTTTTTTTTTTSATSTTAPTTSMSIKEAVTTTKSLMTTSEIVPKAVERQERPTNLRPSSPWNNRRRIGFHRRMFNRTRGRPLTRPLPNPINQNITPDSLGRLKILFTTTTSYIRASEHPSSTLSTMHAVTPTPPSTSHFGTTRTQVSLRTSGLQKYTKRPAGKHDMDTERNLYALLPPPSNSAVSSASSPSTKITTSSPQGVQSGLARSSTSANAANSGDALLAVSLISQVTTNPVEASTANFIPSTAAANNIHTDIYVNPIFTMTTDTPSTTTATSTTTSAPTVTRTRVSTYASTPVATSTYAATRSSSTITTISATASTPAITTTTTSTPTTTSTTTSTPTTTSTTTSTPTTTSTTTSTPTTTTTTTTTSTPATTSTTTSTPATTSPATSTPATTSTTTSTTATTTTSTPATTTTTTTTTPSTTPATTTTTTASIITKKALHNARATTTTTATTSINTKPPTTTTHSSSGPRERPRVYIPGTSQQSRPPTDWRKPGSANSIPDSQSSRTHLPPQPSLPVSPRLPIPRSRPRISDPHIRSVSYPAEGTAWLHCEAGGEPKPAITWTKVSTGAVMSVSSRAQRFEVLPNGTLVIQSLQLQDRGTYICSAHSYMGRDRLLTTLDVWTRPPRMQLPSYRELTTHQGGDLSIDCRAEGVPSPLLSWVLPDRSVLSSSRSSTSRSSTFPSSTAPRFSLDTNGTLHLSAALPTDRGMYRCVASNSAGAASASVRIHVSSLPPVIQQPKEEAFTLSPGMPLYAQCSARGAPNPSLRWKIPSGVYVRPSQYLHGNLFVLPNGTLHIVSMGSKDTGTYECTASNAVGTEKRVVRVQLSGNVAAGNQIVTEQFSTAARKDKTQLDLENSLNATEVAASSPIERPRTVIQPISANALPKISFTPSPKRFTGAVGNDARPVVENNRKIASSSEGSPESSSKVPLKVPTVSQFSKAQIVSTSPSLSTVQAGEHMELHCHVTGNPPPNVIWRTPSRKLVDVHFSFDGRLKMHPNGTLSVGGVTERDGGDYLCIARNKVGDDYRLVRVTVAPKPVQQPAPQPARQPAPQPDLQPAPRPAQQPDRQPGPQPAKQPNLQPAHQPTHQLRPQAYPHPYPQPALQPDHQPDRLPVRQSTTQPARQPHPQPALQPAHPQPAAQPALLPDRQPAPQPARQPHPNPYPLPARQPPSIQHKQPVDQLVPLGKTLQVDCLASGHPEPSVRWSLPDGTIVSSAFQGADKAVRTRRLTVFNNGTLLVGSVGRGEEGEYTCYAENQAGRDTMKVKVKIMSSSSPPTFEDDSTYRVIKVQLGTTAKLPCAPTGDPAPSVTWFSPMNRVIPWTSRSGFYTERVVVSGGTLELRVAQKQDTGNYTCQASNAAGTRSKVVRLEVEVPSAIRNSVPGNHVLNGHVRGVTTQLGRSVVSVGVSGASNVGFRAENLAINRNNIGVNSNKLTNRPGVVLNVETNNNEVVASKPSSDTNRRDIDISSSVANTGLRNSVAGNASVSQGVVLTVKQQVIKGQSVFLHCPAGGSWAPRLTWLLPGNTALGAPHYSSRLTVHRNGTLELRGVSGADQGRFVCVVRGDRGETRLQVELEVEEPHRVEPHPGSPVDQRRPQISPRPVPRTPTSLLSIASRTLSSDQVVSTKSAALVSIINGETLHLPCSAPHSPAHSQGPVSWSLPNGQRLSSSERQGLYSVQTDGTLTVQQASVFDRGTYTCRFSAPSGVVEVTVPVIVIAYPPRITTGPAPVTYTRPGVAVELPCLAIATPRATITWEMPDMSKLTAQGQARIYGNRYLSPQGSLVIQSPSSRDTGFYRCTAKNVIGADTKATYLHVI